MNELLLHYIKTLLPIIPSNQIQERVRCYAKTLGIEDDMISHILEDFIWNG